MTTPSAVSTPSSTSSPSPITPAMPSRLPSLSVKPIAAAAPTPMPVKPSSVTSKEWIIPPRPKPGRKPATDTPPTKRKAQNRAAQRAFRERRAARVGELEEQIRNMEDETALEKAKLNEQIGSLSNQVQHYKTEISWWKKRCQTLETELLSEKNAKTELARRLESGDQQPEPQDITGGCQNCSSTRCQCIDDAFDLSNLASGPNDSSSISKRTRSPHQADGNKRQRSQFKVKVEPEELEIDFTSRFSLGSGIRHTEAVASPAPFDRCGFCNDGTPCICAEMASAEHEQSTNNLYNDNRILPPIRSISQFTPPPSENDTLSEPLPSMSNKANPCANGPGTCAQCVADPKSTLFCKSLAASRANSAAAGGGGCCGGSSSAGGCCRSQPPGNENGNASQNNAATPRNQEPITLSCADAFTTLSRHPNFSRASDELTTWLPRLHTLPKPRNLLSQDNIANRPAMEVEAASVMGVLRYFDRRFAD
ncbi:hypothetical protein AJ80_01154 [Polytolypa hystricis UAMH7299]|uniref:BZIP domain-containing protein n=1 Tax=Polytolypa hystricis (strain UAMH7299) TaxID=1447883 RepID=A0A2B7Z2Y8_POLH7|nr:hypothetical protein AJ80_01154 [Polytolypa hystricis UAMH7299]